MHAAAPNALPAPRKSRASRRRAALALVVVVLAVHGLLLGRAPLRPGAEARSDAARALSVRQIVLPDPAAAPARAPAPAAADPQPVPRPAAAAPKPRAATPRAAPEIDPGPAPGALRDARAAADAAPAVAGGITLPAYATRLAPAATLRYAMQRGDARGQAELRWRPADGRYTLTLDSAGGGLPQLGSASAGSLDATGIAPERYTESRRGRDQRAVNFQAASGRITYSQPSLQHDWLPGAQDRLSWMLQLPAVLEAEPSLRETGSELRLYVAGTRGDAEVWTFDVLGRETLETPAGAVPAALHLRRSPRRPYDVQVDVWLDPGRHHLPVRLLLQPAGTVSELSLEQYGSP